MWSGLLDWRRDEEAKEDRGLMTVRVGWNGTCMIEIPFRSSSFCGINVQLFPFDTQTCTITVPNFLFTFLLELISVRL